MIRAVAECEAAWERFWTAESDDPEGTIFTVLAELARQAQSRAVDTPIESTADAAALLGLARRQLVSWGSYRPVDDGVTDLGGNFGTELDWLCLERACAYFGVAGPVTVRG